MLISPTEPFPLKALGTVSPLPEKAGADILILSKKMRTGVQRKKFPEDLIGSLADGRLYQQIHQMQSLDRSILLIEGFGTWNSDGVLMDLKVTFTRAQYYALLLSISFEFGVQIFQVRDINETMKFLKTLESWAGKDKHMSLRSRPGPAGDAWGRRGNREYAMHLLQSFPGIGPDTAGKIFDKFGRVPMEWNVTEEELRTVPGVGKGRAGVMWKALNG